MKKGIMALVMTLFCLTGCTKVINEYSTIEVGVVTDKHFQDAYTTSTVMSVYTGKTIIMVPQTSYHTAQYNIAFDVSGFTIELDDKEIYEKYEIDDKVEMVVNYKEYSDGTFKKRVIGPVLEK